MPDDTIIGIISDTHDNMPAIRKAVDSFNQAGCSLVIHAGDYIAPFTVREFDKLKAKFIGVFGNNDGEKNGLLKKFSAIGEIHEPPYDFFYRRKHFLVMHTPDYLDKYIKESNADIIIYGHIHKIDCRKGNPLVINPGECCSWLTGKSTVALLDLVTMDVEILEL